jgi:hypothetical protein
LGTTRFDVARALMTAVVLFLLAGIFFLGARYVAPVRTETDNDVALEILELPGGAEDGAIDESLLVESPEEEVPDASLAEEMLDDVEVEQTLETVLDVADQATELVPQQLSTAEVSSGRAGSAHGTGGRRALGSGNGERGLPREQRWFVRYSDGGTLGTYARQLDYFGIEFGLLTPDGKLVYVSNLSRPKPTVRTVDSGAGENRLYMTWQGGNRKQADLELFQKAGIDASRGTIFHFYPAQADAQLAQKEHSYRNKPTDAIRGTYFIVQQSGRGYEFAVTRQTYF